MADGPGSSFANNSAILVALMSAGALLFNHYAPLQGARPPSEAAQIHEMASRQDIDTRLWQDPFSAIARAKADKQTEPEDAKDPHCDTKPPGDDADIIGVMVPGGPYAELEEYRRRTRYAVVSGLDVEDFVPKDPLHIGYFCRAPKDAGKALSNRTQQQPELPSIIPYEVFEHKDGVKKRLVLWLNEDKFAETPLATFAVLFQMLDDAACPSRHLAIVGPRSSDTLRAMVREITAHRSEASALNAELRCPAGMATTAADPVDWANILKWASIERIHFYAFGATAENRELLPSGQQPVDSFLEQKDVHLMRTIATDDVLARAIVHELKLRGVEPGETQHVALISEGDTFYGQTFPTTMANCFAQGDRDKQYEAEEPGVCAHPDSPLRWVRRYTYLRGLDGALPTKKDDGKKTEADPHTASGNDAGKDRSDPRALDRPYGQGQYDYLRRIADDLKQYDDSLRRANKSVRAVGVVGSDVFDKLLVLRALRPQFPDALFFTTDYDAAFTMGSELGWTRNLLIASSFGAKLRTEIQGAIPPFRDVYETSAFLSTRLAATDPLQSEGREPAGAAPEAASGRFMRTGLSVSTGAPPEARQANPSAADARERVAQWLAHARMFEVDRTGGVLALPGEAPEQEGRSADEPKAANAGAPAGHCAETTKDLLKCSDIQPPEDALYPAGRSWLPLIFMPLMVFAIAVFIQYGFHRRELGPKEKKLTGQDLLYRIYWPAIAAIVGLSLIGAWLSWPWLPEHWIGRAGEPLKLIAGDSLWPAIMLRIATLILSFWLFCVSFLKLHINFESLTKRFNLEARSDVKPTYSGFFDRILKNLYFLPKYSKNYSIEEAWKHYVAQGSVISRLVRVSCWVVFAMAMSISLFLLLGFPLNPSRDASLVKFYHIVTFIDVLFMYFLVFMVVDATFFCYRFVGQLAKGPTEWPQGAKNQFKRDLGLCYSSRVLDDWIDLAFIGERTSCINSLIWYPFGVIALMIVARSTIFANFPFSAPIVVTQGVGLVIVVGCAIALNGAAERARALAARNLADEISNAKGRADDERVKLCEWLLDRVKNNREGSFQPFLQQPIIGAILLPLGSIGWTTLFEQAQLFGL